MMVTSFKLISKTAKRRVVLSQILWIGCEFISPLANIGTMAAKSESSSSMLGAAAVAFGAGVGAGVLATLLRSRMQTKTAPSKGAAAKEVKALVAAEVAQAFAASARGKANGSKEYPATAKNLNPLRILITGGAGFVGSNLTDVLMQQGHIVYVMDNLFTGRRCNIEHWIGEN
jgi:hypothetical protein